ncbi:hypothetical protein GCM10011459_09240 [Limosilactobacillus caviae]|uniref:Uncharacterized protein n=1 Tax=Limosilactobacillus caviae TaxID=1769424 RepID=A0ABQ2C4N9_9LACO|nr:hypothetical protein GCM10011459_09240 [Limosilactobacillus caviae]
MIRLRRKWKTNIKCGFKYESFVKILLIIYIKHTKIIQSKMINVKQFERNGVYFYVRT